MDISALRQRLNTVIRLSFADGEEVEARLLGVDPDEHEDITYEVCRIVRAGSPPALGTDVGAIVVVPMAELTDWQPV
jgi:hypothetical protein